MPGLVPARFDADLVVTTARVVDARKPASVAITAVMRKLVVLANALLLDDPVWARHTT